MKIKDILAKVVSGEELSEEETSFLSDYNEPDVSKAKSEAAALARKAEKEATRASAAKVEEMEAELEELREQLEDTSTGKKSEAQKLERQLAKFSKKLEAAEAKAQSLEAEKNKIQRDYAYESLLSKVDFVDQEAREIGYLALQRSVADLDDLSGEEALSAVEDLKSSFPKLVRAEGGSGTGLKPGNNVSEPTENSSEVVNQIVSKPKEQRTVEDIDKMWAAAEQIE